MMSKQQLDEKAKSTYIRKANCCEICLHCAKPEKHVRMCDKSITGFHVDTDGICAEFEIITQLSK